MDLFIRYHKLGNECMYPIIWSTYGSLDVVTVFIVVCLECRMFVPSICLN